MDSQPFVSNSFLNSIVVGSKTTSINPFAKFIIMCVCVCVFVCQECFTLLQASNDTPRFAGI